MKWKIRSEKGPVEVELTRKNAILYFCKECMGWQQVLVDGCTDKMCPFFPFRNSKAIRQNSDRKANPKAVEALMKARKKRNKLPI